MSIKMHETDGLKLQIEEMKRELESKSQVQAMLEVELVKLRAIKARQEDHDISWAIANLQQVASDIEDADLLRKELEGLRTTVEVQTHDLKCMGEELAQRDEKISLLEASIGQHTRDIIAKERENKDLRAEVDVMDIARQGLVEEIARLKHKISEQQAIIDSSGREVSSKELELKKVRSELEAQKIQSKQLEYEIVEHRKVIGKHESTIGQYTRDAASQHLRFKRLSEEHDVELKRKQQMIETLKTAFSSFEHLGRLNGSVDAALASKLNHSAAEAARLEIELAERHAEVKSLRLQVDRLKGIICSLQVQAAAHQGER